MYTENSPGSSEFPGRMSSFLDKHFSKIDVYVPDSVPEMLRWLDENPNKITDEGVHVEFNGNYFVIKNSTGKLQYPYAVEYDNRRPDWNSEKIDPAMRESRLRMENQISAHEFSKLQKRFDELQGQVQELTKLVATKLAVKAETNTLPNEFEPTKRD